MTLPDCAYCGRANATMMAVGRAHIAYCNAACYSEDQLGHPPARSWWRHLPILRWFFLAMLAGCGDGFVLVDSVCMEIVGGELSEIPRSTVRTGGEKGCSGTYIADRVVLASAHCGRPKFVDAGGHERKVLEYIPHPDYDRDGLLHDLALLVLQHPLPTGDGLMEPAVIGLPAYGGALAQGYGADEFGERALRERVVSIRAFAEPTKILVTNSICNGDSGGPLYQDGLVVGLATSGLRRGDNCLLGGAFTAIAPYMDWINSEVDGVEFANGC